MINTLISNQNIKPLINSQMMNAQISKKDSVQNCHATYKKKNGILSITMKEKLLSWKSLSDSSSLSIYFDQISEIKKDRKDKDESELLYIKKVDLDKGIVFVFCEGKIKKRKFLF